MCIQHTVNGSSFFLERVFMGSARFCRILSLPIALSGVYPSMKSANFLLYA
jgi:hypothetical protein